MGLEDQTSGPAFLDGDHAYKILSNLLVPIGSVPGQGRALSEISSIAHPPFQIDGNFRRDRRSSLRCFLQKPHGRNCICCPRCRVRGPTAAFAVLQARGGFYRGYYVEEEQVDGGRDSVGQRKVPLKVRVMAR